jgi:hypothetical protein
MYLTRSTRIPLAIATCVALLPDAVLDAVFNVENDETRVGFSVGPARVRKRVQLVVGHPEEFGMGVRVSVKWVANPAGGLFPQLDGHLQLEALGPAESKLSIRANYQPPMGRVGRVLDDAAMRVVARLTLQDFVESVRDHVIEANRAAITEEV